MACVGGPASALLKQTPWWVPQVACLWPALYLQVQRNWMYLENIFIGSEDIRKQLPHESQMFDGVNQVFMRSMSQLHAVGNVIQATNADGVLATFQVRLLYIWPAPLTFGITTDMNASLQMYLAPPGNVSGYGIVASVAVQAT